MSVTSAVPSPTEAARARLRAATRDLHERIERLIPAHEGWDRATYVDYLTRMRGLYGGIEAQLVDGLGDAYAGLYEGRHKTPLLDADLGALGAIAGLPPPFLPFSSVGAAAGAAYVLEGASLGGRVMARRLAAVLPEEMRYASRFFGGHAEGAWQTFCAALERALPDEACRGAAIRQARATFLAFEACLSIPPLRGAP